MQWRARALVGLWILGCGGATAGGSREGSQGDADAGVRSGGASGASATGGAASGTGGDGGATAVGTGARPAGGGGAMAAGGTGQGGGMGACRRAPCPAGTAFDPQTCGCERVAGECTEDADCDVVDGCCGCFAFSVPAPAEPCVARCSVTTCTWRFGGAVEARCQAGTCQLDTRGSCDAEFCPMVNGGPACCVSRNGPCGVLTASGCMQPGLTTDAGSPAMDPCALPIDPGPCRGLFPAYAYDAESGGCVEFSYGGCEGNANRFETLEVCEMACP